MLQDRLHIKNMLIVCSTELSLKISIFIFLIIFIFIDIIIRDLEIAICEGRVNLPRVNCHVNRAHCRILSSH